MKNIRVLFIWKVREELREYLREGLNDVRGVDLLFPENPTEEFLLETASNIDIVVGWRPIREFLDMATNMRLFINPGAGVQHHLKPFREINQTRRVTLVNGHGNTYFTAQHAVALLLSLTNKIIPHHNWMMEGMWRTGDEHVPSTPFRHRKIGLLGYGAVNSKVHRFLSGFNVEFSILRRSWTSDEKLPTDADKYTPNQLNEFMDAIDTLIVAIPQTDETEGFIRFEHLKKLGSKGLLVNMARGVVIDEEGMFRALKEKVIAAAAIDVWYDYKPEPDGAGRKYPFNYPFNELDNIVLSPHRGASPLDNLERWQEVVENIRRFASGRTDFLNIVDLERGY
ncbi:MAG: NAD(P)-dependent oxidoreductase [Candidatus Thorarchaeota archaeon]|jgi:phosphoglycerate dehydrogenase-like enzyme